MALRGFLTCVSLASVLLATPGCTGEAQTERAPAPRSSPQTIEQVHPSAFETLPLHAPTVGPERARTAAIFMTGDGGWAPFDQNVSADMSRAGVPTSGFDTGAYFSILRTPEEAAAALTQAIDAVMQRYGAEQVILVGYSFGADVGSFILNRLPAVTRSHVDRLALMSPSDIAPFQVTLLERAGLENPGARPVVPELTAAANAGNRIVCLYGERDKDAICPKMTFPSMKGVKLKGGHGLDDNHQAVADAILSAWPITN